MNEIFEKLKNRVLSEPPSLSILEEAEMIAASLPDDELPIWVQMLANGNRDLFEDAIDEAKRWMDAEANHDQPAELRPGDQRGQGLVEVVLVLGLIAVVLLILAAWLPTTPVWSSMNELAAGAASSLAADVDQSMSHGLAKHGPQAQAVYDCIQKNGVYQTWTNPTSSRRANLCQTGDGRWGVQIVNDANEEITAFINKAREFADLVRYLVNQGYIPPQ